MLALLPGQERHLNELKETRKRLANEAIAIVNEYGPKVYEDFDKVCK